MDYSLKLCMPLSVWLAPVTSQQNQYIYDYDYPNVRLLLTEESFHQSCGTWSTVMDAEISFSIDASKSNKGKGKGNAPGQNK